MFGFWFWWNHKPFDDTIMGEMQNTTFYEKQTSGFQAYLPSQILKCQPTKKKKKHQPQNCNIIDSQIFSSSLVTDTLTNQN